MGARRIHRSLGALKAALASGDHGNLGKLITRIEADIAALKPGTLSDAEVADLRTESNRAAELLTAAAEGVRSARERIIAVRTGPKLRTYSQDGRATVTRDQEAGQLSLRR